MMTTPQEVGRSMMALAATEARQRLPGFLDEIGREPKPGPVEEMEYIAAFTFLSTVAVMDNFGPTAGPVLDSLSLAFVDFCERTGAPRSEAVNFLAERCEEYGRALLPETDSETHNTEGLAKAACRNIMRSEAKDPFVSSVLMIEFTAFLMAAQDAASGEAAR